MLESQAPREVRSGRAPSIAIFQGLGEMQKGVLYCRKLLYDGYWDNHHADHFSSTVVLGQITVGLVGTSATFVQS